MSFAVSLIDKDIMEFIRQAGTCRNALCFGLIGKIINKALDDPEIAKIVIPSGLTKTHLVTLYALMLEHLHPDPTINVSGPMLVPTLLFMEPLRLQELVDKGWNAVADKEPTEREGILYAYARSIAEIIYQKHHEAYGPSGFQIMQDASPQKAEQAALAQEKGAAVLKYIAVAVVLVVIFFIIK